MLTVYTYSLTQHSASTHALMHSASTHALMLPVHISLLSGQFVGCRTRASSPRLCSKSMVFASAGLGMAFPNDFIDLRLGILTYMIRLVLIVAVVVVVLLLVLVLIVIPVVVVVVVVLLLLLLLLVLVESYK